MDDATLAAKAVELDLFSQTIEAPAGPAPLYAAKPRGRVQLPILLVAQEIFGLNDHIKDLVRRFARQGYFALAPDYLTRHGVAREAPDIAAARAVVAATPDAETLADFDAARRFAEQSGGDPSRCAITGFCWGGRIAWLYAAKSPELKACVPWYGRLDGPHSQNHPTWPLDIAGDIAVPTLGLYGGADPSIPPELVEEMRARLRRVGAPADIRVFADAPHGFFADYRDCYRPEAAREAMALMSEFLARQGLEATGG